MNLQTYLNERNMTKYHFSKISGVPKTTIMDICSGRSNIEKCSAKTVFQLAKALDCTMEDIMAMTSDAEDNAIPQDKGFLECGLPTFLQDSLRVMIEAWRKIDSGERSF